MSFRSARLPRDSSNGGSSADRARIRLHGRNRPKLAPWRSGWCRSSASSATASPTSSGSRAVTGALLLVLLLTPGPAHAAGAVIVRNPAIVLEPQRTNGSAAVDL